VTVERLRTRSRERVLRYGTLIVGAVAIVMFGYVVSQYVKVPHATLSGCGCDLRYQSARSRLDSEAVDTMHAMQVGPDSTIVGDCRVLRESSSDSASRGNSLDGRPR